MFLIFIQSFHADFIVVGRLLRRREGTGITIGLKKQFLLHLDLVWDTTWSGSRVSPTTRSKENVNKILGSKTALEENVV